MKKTFPFSLNDIGRELGGDGGVGKHFRNTWYFQQLLKFYAFYVIDGLTENILILDADTRANHKIKFVDDDGGIFLDRVSCRCVFDTYYRHMKKTPSRNR